MRPRRRVASLLVAARRSLLAVAVAGRAGRGGQPRARSRAPARAGAPTRSTSGSPTCSRTGCRSCYTASGSAQGRKDYALHAPPTSRVTEIGYQGIDPLTGRDRHRRTGRPYAYLPIVAGGTAFPYQIRVGGKLVRNLRLSGQTLAKIFTNQITNWNDPAITADNNGRALPSLPIIPVVHSEGSGLDGPVHRATSTSEFPEHLAAVHRARRTHRVLPAQGPADRPERLRRRDELHRRRRRPTARSATTSTPTRSARTTRSRRSSNTAGYYTLPTQYNVAVALTKAQHQPRTRRSPNYLLQNLDNVYTYNDTAHLPAVVVLVHDPPDRRRTTRRMTTAKRQTLADFLYYSICEGQKEMGPIGYSPLPDQPGAGRLRPDRQAEDGRPERRPHPARRQRPATTRRSSPASPSANYLAEIAPQAAGLRQGRRRAVRRRASRRPAAGQRRPAVRAADGARHGHGGGTRHRRRHRRAGRGGDRRPAAAGRPGHRRRSTGDGRRRADRSATPSRSRRSARPARRRCRVGSHAGDARSARRRRCCSLALVAAAGDRATTRAERR